MVDHKNHNKFTTFNNSTNVIFVEVTIKMATVQHQMNANKRRKLYICRTREDLNKIFRAIIKATEVASKVQIYLMVGGNKILILPL